MDLTLESTALLLLIAAVVAMLVRRVRLPYSVGLVAAGIVLAFLPLSSQLELTKDLLFTLLLPPLIFEVAFNIKWPHLRKDLAPIITLATVGVALSAAVTALGMRLLAHWTWEAAVIFGVLIAATDPVSVVATFKESRVRGRLLLLIETESLLNDGTAAVLFAVVLAVANGGSPAPLAIAVKLLVTVGGSLLCGAIVAGAALLLTGRTEDHLVEITLTTVAGFGSFLLAEHFLLSGVLATLTAGLMMGNLAAITERGREAADAFWEYAAFMANSLVFLLIGVREARQNFSGQGLVALLAIALVCAGRAVSVYPCCALFRWSTLRVSARHQHALVWGGLRGALALALALGLPADIPEREAILTVSFAVVAFSIFVQGLTMTPLLRRMGEIRV